MSSQLTTTIYKIPKTIYKLLYKGGNVVVYRSKVTGLLGYTGWIVGRDRGDVRTVGN